MVSSTASNRNAVVRHEETPLVYIGEVIDSRFEIERIAGSGGMGTVYRAYDILADRTVALKIMRALPYDKTQRFAREVRTVADVRHKSIVGYVAHGKTRRGSAYLAMEWVDGEDLAARLARGPLALIETLLVVRRIAAALHTVHAAGIVHRDIKPANIALCGGPDGGVKLLDFGVVHGGEGNDAEEATKPGAVVGTLSYMAPEQARGEEIDGRADLFSLGCVLYECLTGKPVFAGTNPAQIVVQLHIGETPLPSASRVGVPAELDALVVRMLAKKPEDRPASAHEIVMWLDALIRDITRIGTLATLPPPP